MEMQRQKTSSFLDSHASEDGIVNNLLSEKSIFEFSNFFDSSLFVKRESFALFTSSDFSSNLVFHPFVCVRILESFILFGESQLLQGRDTFANFEVFRGRQYSVQLTVVCAEQSTVKDIFSLTFGKLTLEKNTALIPKNNGKIRLVLSKVYLLSLTEGLEKSLLGTSSFAQLTSKVQLVVVTKSNRVRKDKNNLPPVGVVPLE